MRSPPAEAPQALAAFCDAAETALSTNDRAAFDAACHGLCIAYSLPLRDALSSHTLAANAHLSALVGLATDRHWLDLRLPTSPTSWAFIVKRQTVAPVDHHSSAAVASQTYPISPPPQFTIPYPPLYATDLFRSFIPALPAHPLPLPTALVSSGENGVRKTSFRRWKWDASALPALSHPHISPPSPLDTTSDTSSVGSAATCVYSVGQPPHPAKGAEFEAALLADMPHLSSARPAAVAAAGAFRALAPFLGAEERAAVRTAFRALPPVDCLAMVARVAERASTKLKPPVAQQHYGMLPEPLHEAPAWDERRAGTFVSLSGGGGVWSGAGGGRVRSEEGGAWDAVFRGGGREGKFGSDVNSGGDG